MKINTLEYVIGIVVTIALCGIGILIIMSPDQNYVAGNNFSMNHTLLLQQASQFVEHRRVLSGVSIDTSLFSDPLFLNLRTDNIPVSEQPIGKNNLFEPMTTGNLGL